MPEVRLGLRQVQRRVGDVDGGVVGGDLALVLAGIVEHRAPRVGRVADHVDVVHQQVGAPAVRDAVHLAVDRVPRLVLEERRDRRVVGHQGGVHRGDVAGVDQPQRRVTGRRHPVVLTAAHQLHHLVGGVADLDVDLAAGLLLERRHPVDGLVVGAVLGVAGPRDEVQLDPRRRRPSSSGSSFGGVCAVAAGSVRARTGGDTAGPAAQAASARPIRTAVDFMATPRVQLKVDERRFRARPT